MPRPYGTSQPKPAPLTLPRVKRLARGFTLQALSNRAGLPINAISQIERRTRIATSDELAALAWALDVADTSTLMREVNADLVHEHAV